MRSSILRVGFVLALRSAALCAAASLAGVPEQSSEGVGINTADSIRLAVADLSRTYGSDYAKAPQHLQRLRQIQSSPQNEAAKAKLYALAQQALLDNPLLKFDSLLVLKRKKGQLGLPVNHKCNSGIPQTGYDNEIAALSPPRPGGKLHTVYRPRTDMFVGEIDLNFQADRLLFTMPNGRTWQIHEIAVDGTGLRQVSREQPDVDNFDACYLPDGRIVFASTASYHAVPCWHGKERACAIYQMAPDGTAVRQLCFDQDLDLHPSVLSSGQVIYSRWDYSGPMHMYLRPLMAMNPDGTGQRAVYGSNSYWPNALYFPRGIPGAPNKLVAVIAGYHGVPRMGELALIDLNLGSQEADGIVQRIPGRGRKVLPVIRDNLVDKSWPKFLHPFPLSDKYFLVASEPEKNAGWGIYLVDVFDNMTPILVDNDFDFFEPVPVMPKTPPAVIPDKVDLGRNDAIVYLHDVYAGQGLQGVPRGTIARLRVISYEFGYPGMAGPDKIGSGGPWEVMRILGTVPVRKDGSAMFRAPANTPLSVQAVDPQGRALQLMRSWFTAMPGETLSCVGCHEKPNEVPPAFGGSAAKGIPAEIEPWYGPPRGFDFAREVQPVLDRYCAGCHDGKRNLPDLRRLELVPDYQGRELADLGQQRLHPDVRKALGGTRVKYTPAYEALLPFIRRVGIEDDIHMLVPGEYHADTSELVQMLKKGHHAVQLDDEAWRRLYTWIDLNAPCHGSWRRVAPIPQDADQKRKAISRAYGNITGQPEDDPPSAPPVGAIIPPSTSLPDSPTVAPEQPAMGASEAKRRQEAMGNFVREITLAGPIKLKLVHIPADHFAMPHTQRNTSQLVTVNSSFWIGAFEVTNRQYRCFDPSHRSGYFAKRYQGRDGPGLSLDGDNQPVVRVSWNKAIEFCKWLSARTNMRFTLPTETQWDYACRAGSSTEFYFGPIDSDYSAWANLADRSLSIRPGPTGGLASNITDHKGNGIFLSALLGGDIVCDGRFDDGSVVTADVGSYRPNTWGLYDMHGNASEWTASDYISADGEEMKMVCAGSFHDRACRAGSAFRLGFAPWRRIFNVGFRVLCEEQPNKALATQPTFDDDMNVF